MPETWSPAEVAATVADYLDMLELELRHAPYNKRDHNRNLLQQLNGRSAGAIEFKHCNISARPLPHRPRLGIGNSAFALRVSPGTALDRRG